MNKPMIPSSAIRGEEHWTDKGADVRLFMWEKYAGDPTSPIRHDPVRARLLDGIDSDIQPAGCRPP